jgi:hypothetical protein
MEEILFDTDTVSIVNKIEMIADELHIDVTKLYDYLREKKMLDINNEPFLSYRSHFRLVYQPIPSGGIIAIWNPTQYGQNYIIKMIKTDGVAYINNRKPNLGRNGYHQSFRINHKRLLINQGKSGDLASQINYVNF